MFPVPGGPAAANTGKDLFIIGKQKLYLSTTLHQHELLFELHKMGCTAEIVLAGAWAHTVESKDLGGLKQNGTPIAKDSHVRRGVLVQLIAKALSKGTTFTAWLEANVPKISHRVVGAQSANRTKQAALTAAVAAGLGAGTTAVDVDAAFVVAVFGNVAPLSPEVKDLLPSNVLLLQAPPPTASPPTAAAEIAHGGRLRGFYPVRVARAGTAVQLCEVPVPMAPPPKEQDNA